MAMPTHFQFARRTATLLLLAVLASQTTLMAADRNPRIAPPGSNPLGASYALWGAAWWQWVFSLPANYPPNPPNSPSNPLLSSGAVDCSYGQLGGPQGHVWFLAGSTTGGTITRSCNVPSSTWLFFPVLNGWADNVATVPPMTIEELKQTAAGFVDNPKELHASIDGVAVQNLLAYRAAFAPFLYVVPKTDNMLGYLYKVQVPGTDWSSTFIFPAASDGYWLMLEPLPPGTHTINFGGTSPTDFQLNVTYEITVVPRGHF